MKPEDIPPRRSLAKLLADMAESQLPAAEVVLEDALNCEWWRGYHAALKRYGFPDAHRSRHG